MSRIAETSQGQTPQIPAPSRSKLVQRLLDASDNLPAFLNDLLTTQAVLVAGTEAAAFLSEKQQEGITLKPVAHIRPDESDMDTRNAALKAFLNIVQPCVEQGKDGAIEVGSPDGGDSQYCLVTILRNEGEVIGACAVVARARDLERAKQRLTSMQLVAGYFELFSLKRHVEQSRAAAERHQQVLQYAGAVATAEGFESAAMNLCNEVATRAGASRVAIGWLKGRRIRVKALSHTEKFDKKQELVVQIEKVMEECYDQEEAVRFDPNGDCTQNVTRAAAELSRAQGANSVLSVPLRHREDIVGILTVEWAADVEVDEEDEAGVGVAADLLAPQLYDRHENDRLIVTKIAISTKKLAKMAVGPKHTGIKLLIAAVIGLGVFIAMFSPMYHVRASVVLTALDRRTSSAPFDGNIERVNFRLGHRVKAGDVLATLRTDQLQTKHSKALLDAESKKAEADKYLAAGGDKMPEYFRADAERRGLLKEAEEAAYDIERASIKAPVDGIIIKGDLMDRRGQVVKEGEALFEIAPLDPRFENTIALEAEIQVPERDIQDVDGFMRDRRLLARAAAAEKGGDTLNAAEAKELKELRESPVRMARAEAEYDGDLATTTFPDRDFKFKIYRIVQNGEPKEGENTFKVYAEILKPEDWMKPGLAGEARVNVVPRSLWWIWTHRLGDWLKLKVWSWL